MKILWPFNPFDKNKKLHKTGKEILTHFFDKKDYLEAVYVASNKEVQLATAFNISIKERYSEYPKNLISSQLKKLSLHKINIEVCTEKSLSLTAAVNKIVDHSKRTHTELIVLATNAKKHLPCVVFGSFAESLMHLSLCDLLIYHQKTKIKLGVPQNIIYAHDFSAKGASGLERVLLYVKKWNSSLTIVHIPVLEFGMNAKTFEEKVQKQASKLEKNLAAQNILFTMHIEFSEKSIPDVILGITKKTNGDIIALTAQADKLAVLLGGSVTRQVLRESSLPTLVLKV